MYPIKAPSVSAEESFRACVSSVRGESKRDRLLRGLRDIQLGDSQLVAAISSGTVHLVDSRAFAVRDVSGEEMISLYDDQMVRAGTAGRRIYDAIVNSGHQGRCGLCGFREAGSLDHFVPKSTFASVAVDPTNLIPACGPCNLKKSASLPTSPDKQYLHPYFDGIDDAPWLAARIDPHRRAVTYFVEPPTDWDPVFTARVVQHFSVFRVDAAFAASAADELVSIRGYLDEMYLSGSVAVEQYLGDMARSARTAGLNSWRRVFYATTAADSWFCSGGFALQ